MVLCDLLSEPPASVEREEKAAVQKKKLELLQRAGLDDTAGGPERCSEGIAGGAMVKCSEVAHCLLQSGKDRRQAGAEVKDEVGGPHG